ncbi:MAG: ferrous iron transport protein A [Deltaproteobacteria bacterium]|nr:ferrous iron transport protein A [Deltaproteobacteria bacterium]
MFPLGLLAIGEKAEVAENRGCSPGPEPVRGAHRHRHKCRGCGMHGGHGAGSHARIEDMGIRPGKTVEMLNNEGGRALLIKVDETRIAVSRSVAMKIMVRRTGDESGDAQTG